jgi:phage-related protein
MKGLPYFEFNNIRSLDEKLIITNKSIYTGSARDVTFTSVPGRSGDLLIDNKRFKNVKLTYDVAVIDDAINIPDIARRVKGWLLSEVGYFKLWDSYDPKYFRLAAYSDEFKLEQELPSLGTSTISFNCKPFRYSKRGQKPLTLENGACLLNPEMFSALPLIKIVGEGDITLSINGDSFVFRGVEEYIEVDSEEMRAYKGDESANDKMYTPTFPTLYKGNNTLTWTGEVTSVEIIPRWCCL